MYFATSSLWSDPEKTTQASPSPSSPKLELFPKLGGEGPGSEPLTISQPKNDLNYLKAMLGDNPPTPGGLFDYGLTSLNLMDRKSNQASPPTILESTAEGDSNEQQTLLKVTAPSFNPGNFDQGSSNIRYVLFTLTVSLMN